MSSKRPAVILFSGGLDSTTCLAIAKAEGFDCYALSFSYGQKHVVETKIASLIAEKMGVVEHKVLTLPLDAFGGSSLTDKEQTVSDYKVQSGVPNTYVPARNTVFLSFALAYAEVIGAHDIFIGANVVDYSGYPDCRPEYIQAFERMATLATKIGQDEKGIKIHVPLIDWDKAEIIRQGLKLSVDYSATVSCYRADDEGQACGKCDSCFYRKKGFEEAGFDDPTIYV